MTIQDTLAAFGLSEYTDVLSPQWEASQQTVPSGMFFLDPAFVREACRETYVPKQVADAAVRTAERVAACEAARALGWYMHYVLFRSQTADWDIVCKWPRDFSAALEEDGALFYLLVLLSGLPGMQQIHRERGIPADIIRATIFDLRLWIEMMQQRSGKPIPSFGPVNVAWLSNHFRVRLYRLVRLQFQFGRFENPHRAFRHRDTRAVLVLPESGLHYTAQGQRSRTEGADGGWTSQFEMTDTEVIGHPILPTGRALPQTIRLPLAEWTQILGPHDPVINLHIPGGEPMTHAACGESFRTAMEFFPQYYPEYTYKAFVCGSWILNSWLEEVLPPESNLVRFQREVYLYPIPLWLPSMYDRVFNVEEMPEDVSQLPRDTQLQRAIVDALASGRGVGAGAGGLMLFPEDFNWGAEVYRNQKLPIKL